MGKDNSRTSGKAANRVKERIPLVKKIKKAVVYITLGLIVLFFYQAYFG